MGDAENALSASKKSAAGRQLSRDDPGLEDGDETTEQENESFKRASDEGMEDRRIVKVRRSQTSSIPSVPSSDPFAGICLVPSAEPHSASAKNTVEEEISAENPSDAQNEKESVEKIDDKHNINRESEKKNVVDDKQLKGIVDELEAVSSKDKEKTCGLDEAAKPKLTHAEAEEVGKTEYEANNDQGKGTEVETKNNEGKGTEIGSKKNSDGENGEKSTESASFNSFQQLSGSQNAFTGLAGTGFSCSPFSFGSLQKDGSLIGSGSLFGPKNYQPSSFGLPYNGNSLLFCPSGASSIVNKDKETSKFSSMKEAPIETGEENEKVVFTADSALFEFLDGSWKERGKGELKLNFSTIGKGKARLVMRARGNYRLILNASLYPEMKLTKMDKKGISFACVNSISDGKDSLSTFALKFKDASVVQEFCYVVTEHNKSSTTLRTPENSRKALND